MGMWPGAVIIGCIMGLGLVLGWSSQLTLPCFEHSVHTVSLAPSITTCMGFSRIFRPQTSHRKDNPSRLFLLYPYVYSCRIKKPLFKVKNVESSLRRIRSIA